MCETCVERRGEEQKKEKEELKKLYYCLTLSYVRFAEDTDMQI